MLVAFTSHSSLSNCHPLQICLLARCLLVWVLTRNKYCISAGRNESGAIDNCMDVLSSLVLIEPKAAPPLFLQYCLIGCFRLYSIFRLERSTLTFSQDKWKMFQVDYSEIKPICSNADIISQGIIKAFFQLKRREKRAAKWAEPQWDSVVFPAEVAPGVQASARKGFCMWTARSWALCESRTHTCTSSKCLTHGS